MKDPIKDPIIEEIRELRRQLERQFDDDPKRLLDYICKKQQEHPEKLITRKFSHPSKNAA